MNSPSTVRPHHHGNLKDALIKHALEAARTGTIESLSLRQASRELGVSPGAVYRHFADKDALLRSLAQHGFDALAQRFEAVMPYDSIAADTTGARARFVALTQEYVDFAQQHYGLWRLMFGPYGAATPTPHHRASTYDWLRKSLSEMAAHGLIAHAGPEAQFFAWTAIHGLSDLQASPAVSRLAPGSILTTQCDLIIAALRRPALGASHSRQS
jgi:AcrR family transcriptional regulator